MFIFKFVDLIHVLINIFKDKKLKVAKNYEHRKFLTWPDVSFGCLMQYIYYIQ